MHEIRLAVLAGIAAIFTGSGAAEDGARIFVYAQRETPARSWMSVGCDGKVVAEVRRGAYFAVNVSPGRHMVAIEGGVPVWVEVPSGEDAFVRLDWHYEVGRPSIPILTNVNADRARREMMFLSYSEAKRIHSGSVPKADPRPPMQPRLKTREAR